MIVRAGDLVVRAMTDSDEPMFAAWLADERVQEWYQADKESFDDDVRRCIIVEDGRPVGYLQFYPVIACAHEYELDPRDCDGVWALDILIGLPERWGSGLGTAALELTVEHLMVTERARQIVVDTRLDNARALRSYEKVGFRTEHLLAEHEVVAGEARDCSLMVLDALDHPVGLAAHLARIDSVNPGLVDGASGERSIAHAVAAWADVRGLTVELSDLGSDRWNVLVTRHGRGGGRSLLFNAHLDTVGPAATEVRLGDGRLEGRGVLDTKGGLAAALLAAAAFSDGELAGDVMVAGVADEEWGSVGTEALVRSVTPDAAVVLEPTDLRIAHRHRGFVVISATVHGRAAHTSRPERGVNAVHAAAHVIRALEQLDRSWASVAHDTVMRPAVVVSGVRSDGEPCTVPARCVVMVEVRTTADAHDEQVASAMRVIEASVSRSDAAAGVEVQVRLDRRPLGTGPTHPLVGATADAVGPSLHRQPELATLPYWTDAALHHAAGTPAVVFGPVGEGLHEDHEWVTTVSLHQCRDALIRLARTWCGDAAAGSVSAPG